MRLFTTAKLWKQPNCPSTDKPIKKLRSIYTMEYYLPIKNENLPFVTTWMDMECIILHDISQRKTNTV